LTSYTSVVARDRAHQRLLQALRELPVDTQVMIELHYWEGLTLTEIAEVVGRPLNTVKTQLRRGRLRLADALAQAD
jgi:RNA polymerase sigma-70 factor (ECF subfamily)